MDTMGDGKRCEGRPQLGRLQPDRYRDAGASPMAAGSGWLAAVRLNSQDLEPRDLRRSHCLG